MNKMNKIELHKIELHNLKLKTFTEQDVLDYCLLNNINPDKIIELWLSHNLLTDISGIKLFKNLKRLYMNNNKIKDISVIQYLKNLEILYIHNLKLKSDQIEYINSLKNLRNLWCYNGFKDMSVLDQLNKNINIYY